MRRLTGWDAYMLYSETPTVHNHTLKVAVIGPDADGRSLTLSEFRRTLEAYLPQLEPLRFRLVKVPAGLHHPMWRENCAVDLDQHLFTATAAAPGGRHELDAAVGEIASTPLDRGLPLWSFHFIDGLQRGRVAIVAKVHHALADGVASANLMAAAITQAPKSAVDGATASPDPQPDRRSVLRAAMHDYRRTSRLLPRVLADTAVGITRSVRMAEKAPAPDARPLHAAATFLNRRLTPDRAFGTATLNLPDVKAVSKDLGVTVNDVVLALAAGALREMFLVRGQEPVAVVAAVAVASNRDPSRIYGNHLAAMMTSLPADEPDLIARCQRVRASTTVAKRNLDLLGLTLVEKWMEFIPPRTSAKAFEILSSRSTSRNRMMNLPISNVPGPRETGHVAGFPMVELYSVGPLYNRCGLNITVWSYVDQLNVSVLTDPSIVAEPSGVAQLMADGLSELQTTMERKPHR